jgi:hypothetical protein
MESHKKRIKKGGALCSPSLPSYILLNIKISKLTKAVNSEMQAVRRFNRFSILITSLPVILDEGD